MRAKKHLILALCICAGLLFNSVAAAVPAKLVNLTVTDAQVRDVLTALSAVGRISIVADDSVTGKITIELKNIPFETALDLVTKTKGLTYQVVSNVIVVSSPEKMSKGFGTVQVIKLKYAKAEDLKKSLVLIIPDDRIKVDNATNSLVFVGTDSEAHKLAEALKNLDVPYEQVSLEAQVVAISKSASKDLGIQWEWDKTPTQQSTDSDSDTSSSTSDSSSTKGSIKFGSYNGKPFEFLYQAQINALVAKGNAKILAKPKISTIDGKEAVIFIGDHIPVLTEKKENGVSTYSTEYVDAGIKLSYTPRINADGLISAKVHTEVSTPTLVSEIKNYKITTRQADTQVRMKNGETLVIGGLIGSEESKNNSRIPFLSQLPILGNLFRNVSNSKTETEVVIFLTAKIIEP